MIIGSEILFFENLPSTNTYAGELLKKKSLREGTILYTNFQSAGRGFSTNKWESENGKNLLISVILYPTFINLPDQFSISMTISLGICDFLDRFTDSCSIKWPNDIYVANDKIAGILIESAIAGEKIEYTVAGIGLNVNQREFSDFLPNPVSLSILSDADYDIHECLDQLCADLDKRYKQLIAGNPKIKAEYTSRLYRLNEWAGYKDNAGTFEGRILLISDDGRIMIERQNGGVTGYSFKEVEFII